MSNILTSITHEIESYIQCTGSTMANIFQFVTLFGKFLWQSMIFIVETTISCMFSLADGLLSAKNDFVLFIQDLTDVFETVLKFLGDTGDHIVLAIFSCVNSFKTFFIQLHLLVHAIFESVLDLILCTLINAKALLILIGNSTIFLVQLGPNLLLSIACGVTSAISWLLQLMWDYFLRIANAILVFFKSVHYELSDIPPSSLFGVLLAIVISLVFFFFLKSVLFYWQIAKSWIAGNSWLRMPKFKRPSSLQQGGKLEMENHSTGHLLRQLEQEREDKLCVICHDHFKCVILLPCRHFCLCQTCVDTIQESNPICPLCRHFVTHSLKVYT
ncbi:uncharacterized protein LOC130685728 [Daphnia carinata]|uniref:uncharacterized protein LOC130685728 n=1 Tax=Daphnia carinata TaxID=120202 RepID=UPI00257F54C7|nr:uncharacterized protein LOC130685728 [Daphnia carinata]